MHTHYLCNRCAKGGEKMDNYREIVDLETGEVIEGKVISRKQWEGYKRKRQLEAIHDQERHLQEFWAGRDFTFMHMLKASHCRYTSTELGNLGAILVLATYTVFDKDGTGNSILGYSCNNLFKSVERDISKVLSVSIPHAKRYYRTLKEHGFIDKKNGTFYIDSELFYRGSSKNKNSVKLYHIHTRKLLEKGFKLADIGLLFLTAPFIDFKTNILVRNPYRTKEEAICIDLEELADLINVDRSTLFRKFKKMYVEHERTGKVMASYLTVKGNVNNKKIIIVNPILMHRYNDEETWCNIDLFMVTSKEVSDNL